MTDARRREPLTRDRILAAALALVDQDGLDRLSMRRLGQRLGVDPMAIYHHVPSKSALLDGLVEQVWSGVTLPVEMPGERWQDVLREGFRSLRARLLAHPQLVRVLGSGSSTTPGMLRVVDDVLGRLVRAGLAAEDAMAAVDCLAVFTIGSAQAEVGARTAEGRDPQEALGALDPSAYPHLVQVVGAGYGNDPEATYLRGLEALLAGWPGVRPAEPRG